MASNPPQEGCCTLLTIQEGESIGKVTQVVDYKTYIIGDLTVGGKYVVIFTDVYGLELVNVQFIADKLHAALGYTVVIPDIIKSDPFPTDGTGDFGVWFSHHPPAENKEITQTFLKRFSEQYKPSYTAGIGYCFGAKYVAQNLTEGGYFNVGAFAHPSFVDEEELEKVAVPLLISAAQTDSIFTPELRFKSEEILNKNNASYQIDLFSQTSHGFAVRGDRSIPAVKYAAEKTLTDQVNWFKRFDKDASSKCCC